MSQDIEQVDVAGTGAWTNNAYIYDTGAGYDTSAGTSITDSQAECRECWQHTVRRHRGQRHHPGHRGHHHISRRRWGLSDGRVVQAIGFWICRYDQECHTPR